MNITRVNTATKGAEIQWIYVYYFAIYFYIDTCVRVLFRLKGLFCMKVFRIVLKI